MNGKQTWYMSSKKITKTVLPTKGTIIIVFIPKMWAVFIKNTDVPKPGELRMLTQVSGHICHWYIQLYHVTSIYQWISNSFTSFQNVNVAFSVIKINKWHR